MAAPELAYQSLMNAYLSVKESEFIGMNRSRDVIIGESLKLASYSKEDQGEFQTISRFKMEYIASLPLRIDGFIHAANEFFFAEDVPAQAKAEWSSIEPDAEALKRKVGKRTKTIAEEEGDITTVKEMNRIFMGQGRYDLLDDITKLNRKAKAVPEKMASIGITPEDLKKLDEYETRLKALVGDIDREPAGLAEKKRMMFAAYTYLMQAVNPICEYGQMLFEGTDRAELYKSQSLSKNASGRPKSDSVLPASTSLNTEFGL